ncbi:MAG: hypothetical protein GY941_16210 [Planctomycetes bacterium]|nr:hypothetical protein [Planctomycetota bacterium]
MKKSDLKSGMLVELRNKKVLMVLNLMLIRADGDYYPLSYYNDDLTFYKKEAEGYLDIINVSNIQNGAASTTKNWTFESITNDLLWQREEKEMIEIDGVEYDLDYVKRKLGVGIEGDTVEMEEPKEEKKKFEIEYENCFVIDTEPPHRLGNKTNAKDLNSRYGMYRKTLKNAEYSLKRNQRANRLEALVEELQGELGGNYSIYQNDVGNYRCRTGWADIGAVTMLELTADKICEMLNNEEYKLDV